MVKKLYYGIIMMLISPVLTLGIAFRSSDRRFKLWMLILFTTIFGSIIVIGNSDGYRHWLNVYNHYVGLSFSQFLSEAGDILLFRPNHEVNEDLYIHVISYLTGSVLSLPGLFYVVVAFVYGYFFSCSMFRLFTVFPKFNKNKLFFAFAIVFILLLSIVKMNTVRTWTGAWILFYACISYYQTGQKKYLMLMFVPPFIHFAFFVIAIPAWIVAFAGNRKMIYVIIFIASFATTLISPNLAMKQLRITEVGENKVYDYKIEQQSTIEGTLKEFGSLTFYAQYIKANIHTLAIAAVAFMFIFFGIYFRSMTNLECSLFSIGILTYALSNTTWYISALSNRSVVVAALFILASLLLYWQRHYVYNFNWSFPKSQRLLLTVVLITLGPYFIYKLIDITYYTNIFMVVFPFLPWFFDGLRISIREILGLLPVVPSA